MSETVYNFDEISSLSSLHSLMLRKENFCSRLDLVKNGNYNIDWVKKKDVLLNCGTFVEYKGGKVNRANFCRERFCPLCQHRRSLKMYSEILKKLNSFELKYSCIHCVLTIPNCDINDLLSKIQLLFSASSRLFKSYTAWKGIGRFLEVSYSVDTDTYHPHLHCIVLVLPSYFHSRYYVSHEKLREDWGKLVGVPNVQVHLSAKGEDKSLIAEVAKYCTKPYAATSSDYEFSRLLDVFEVIKGKRLVQFYGALKGIKLEDLDDTLVLEDSEEHTITPLVWDRNLHRYNLLIP